MKSYEELQKRIESFIDEDSNETFDELILEVHDFQKRNCEILKITLTKTVKVQSWKEITPIPTEAFKNAGKIISFLRKEFQKLF